MKVGPQLRLVDHQKLTGLPEEGYRLSRSQNLGLGHPV